MKGPKKNYTTTIESVTRKWIQTADDMYTVKPISERLSKKIIISFFVTTLLILGGGVITIIVYLKVLKRQGPGNGGGLGSFSSSEDSSEDSMNRLNKNLLNGEKEEQPNITFKVGVLKDLYVDGSNPNPNPI